MTHSAPIRPFAAVWTVCLLCGLLAIGCQPAEKPYGAEHQLEVPGLRSEVWAIAPAVNLSGHHEVDPILQADLLFNSLQNVKGMTAIPVDRVVQTYAGLNIDRIESPDQAALVCDLLGVDALVVPTITAYDPYDPPKIGASLALFRKPRNYVRPAGVDLTELAQNPPAAHVQPKQAVGMFDAGDGSVREALLKYAAGRSDPNGPMAEREYFLSMDRYGEFVYFRLIAELLDVPPEPVVTDSR
jgi:hypothetical protein